MTDIREAVICEPVRTAVGRFGGMYRSLSAVDLGVAALRGLLDRTGLPGDVIDDVIFAQCYPSMEAPALGRVVALDAGLPTTVTGMQLDRRCGSGLQAVVFGAMTVATGAADCIVVGGAESMSNPSFYTHAPRWGVQGNFELMDSLQRGRLTAGGVNFPVPGGMIETAENLRADYSVSREAQDAFALHSHEKAVAAQNGGVFDDEIVPVTVTDRKKGEIVHTKDEHPRPDVTMEQLAQLKPIMGRSVEGATVTAGNASGQNDGGSAAIVCTRDMAQRHGLRVFATLKSWAVAGVEPARMGIGPVPAAAKALNRAGLSMDDMGVIELNEAFASQVLAVLAEWGIDAGDDRLNPHGSGISLGHPVGATGGRILATLLREMERRECRYGLETMCIGGGQGLAAVFERAV